MIGKCGAQRAALVVVAGQQVVRHRQRREELAQVRVLLGAAEIDEIAGDHRRVGQLRQPQDLLHAALEHRRAVDHAIRELPRHLDVQVADLAEEERVGVHKLSSAA